MIRNFSTPDPDSTNGRTVNVTVHWTDVPVANVELSRAENDGNPRALQAKVTFGAGVTFPANATDFGVDLVVKTANHDAPMMDGLPVSSLADLQTETQNPWVLNSTSEGVGAIQSVEVRTNVS